MLSKVTDDRVPAPRVPLHHHHNISCVNVRRSHHDLGVGRFPIARPIILSIIRDLCVAVVVAMSSHVHAQGSPCMLLCHSSTKQSQRWTWMWHDTAIGAYSWECKRECRCESSLQRRRIAQCPCRQWKRPRKHDIHVVDSRGGEFDAGGLCRRSVRGIVRFGRCCHYGKCCYMSQCNVRYSRHSWGSVAFVRELDVIWMRRIP